MSATGDEPRIDAVCLGETMALFRAEQAGPLTHARSFSLSVGGAESNVAVGLARLGTRAAWVGRVGTDSLGDLVRHELRGEGVTVYAGTDESAPTGLMIKERRTPSTQRVTYYRRESAGSRLRPEDLPVDVVRRARVLHVSGITPALSASARETADQAVSMTKDAGGTVSFDVNYRSALWAPDDAAAALRPLAAAADILFASAAEAELLTGETEPHAQARALQHLGAKQVVIKRGAEGAAAVAEHEWVIQRAFPVDAIDTVGAGDAFVAGYLAEWLEGEPVQTRLATAARCGAFACLMPGDWEGLPTRADLSLLDAEDPVSR